ncbi:MAG TPA: sulfotransferase [bacterium]|nr:sulfotransferase [bacterium]
MVKPNFFIVGAPKCGTTALSEYLRNHPNVFMSSPKEPYYFDFDLKKKVQMEEKTYLKLFSNVNKNIHTAIGEASTTYLYSKVAVKAILEFNPESKFIVMVRNPIELVQSLHSQHLYAGGETILDFVEAWDLQEERQDLSKFVFETKRFQYAEWGLLGKQLEYMLGNVNARKVMVIVFDDFQNRTKEIYEDVLRFLEVPLDGRIEFSIINENRSISNVHLQRVFARLIDFKLYMHAKFGTPEFGLLNKFSFLYAKKNKRKKISLDVEEKLKAYYFEDVKLLSKILGRDLTAWVAPGK